MVQPRSARFDVRRIDLNLLVSLHHLLQECHVTAAAERMAVSQPSMSASLARLRRLLDDPLLVRVGRGLVLTPYAEGLRDSIAAILQDVEIALSTRPTFDPVAESREFSIAATDYVTFILLTDLVARLGEQANVHIQVKPIDENCIEDLRANTVDLVIAPREVMADATDLVGATLFRDRLVGIRRRDDDTASARPAPTDDEPAVARETVATLPYVAYRPWGRPSHLDGQLESLGLTPNIKLTTQHLLGIPLMVSESELVSFVYERLALRMATCLPLEVFAPPVAMASVTQAVYWHPRRSDDPAHRWLREEVIRLGRALT